MTHGRQIVDFVRLHLLNDADEIGGIGQVAVVQLETLMLHVRIRIQMVNTVCIEKRAAALDAKHHITFVQQQLGEIRAILAGHTGINATFLFVMMEYRIYYCSAVERRRLIRLSDASFQIRARHPA